MNRKPDIDRDREAYLATLRSPSREVLKHRLPQWPLYAAVAGSALALAGRPPVTGRLVAAEHAPQMRAARPSRARRKSRPLFASAAAFDSQQSQLAAPAITPGGVVPLWGTVSLIQPGQWISIFGTNLASGTAVWNGDFPLSLGGTRVEIDGRAAYLSFVSPTQINAQAPNDTALGPVPVVVTTATGTATSMVTLAAASPNFDLLTGSM